MLTEGEESSHGHPCQPETRLREVGDRDGTRKVSDRLDEDGGRVLVLVLDRSNEVDD